MARFVSGGSPTRITAVQQPTQLEMNDACGHEIRFGDLVAVTGAHRGALINLARVVSVKNGRVSLIKKGWSWTDTDYRHTWMKKLKRILVLERAPDHVVDALNRWNAGDQSEPIHEIAGMTESEFTDWAVNWTVR